ncbi:MAG TPA: hypothetical protein VGM54_23035 [Chthoniobacter sp.]|jgi:hypothetical protein
MTPELSVLKLQMSPFPLKFSVSTNPVSLTVSVAWAEFPVDNKAIAAMAGPSREAMERRKMKRRDGGVRKSDRSNWGGLLLITISGRAAASRRAPAQTGWFQLVGNRFVSYQQANIPTIDSALIERSGVILPRCK